MRRIMLNLTIHKKMRYFLIILSLLAFCSPSSAITTIQFKKQIRYFNSSTGILLELENDEEYERVKIKKGIACNLENKAGINTHSSLLSALTPQPIPIFNQGCKVKKA